jgi:hypothetical protein
MNDASNYYYGVTSHIAPLEANRRQNTFLFLPSFFFVQKRHFAAFHRSKLLTTLTTREVRDETSHEHSTVVVVASDGRLRRIHTPQLASFRKRQKTLLVASLFLSVASLFLSFT